MNDLESKVAIVTGGGSGIGRAVAQLYAANETKVVVADIDKDGGNKTVSMIEKDGGESEEVA